MREHFLVKSESTANRVYNVDLQIGICNCKTGETGKVYKHQITCSKSYLLDLPQAKRELVAESCKATKKPLAKYKRKSPNAKSQGSDHLSFFHFFIRSIEMWQYFVPEVIVELMNDEPHSFDVIINYISI